MKPTFSIITPTFNRGYIIWRTIQSLQKQIYPFWEMLVIDDGSTDNTQQVVSQFQKDPRIQYFHKKNAGPAEARNYGLERAQGNIITYLDSDDRFYDICLSTVLEFFDKSPKSIFAIPSHNRRVELYDNNGKLIDFTRSSASQKQEITLQDIYHWSIKPAYGSGLFHKRIVTEKDIRWDPKLKGFEDWDFITQIGNIFPKGFLYIPFVLVEYLQRYNSDTLCSQTTYQTQLDAFEGIYQKHKNDPLMKGQKWYPAKIIKYKNLQKQFEAGKIPPQTYKYFPKFAPKRKI